MVLQLGLVGHGRWGRNIERTLSSFSDVSVKVIEKGERPPARLDGVLIATPSASHVKTALPYIEAGITTFIEKPMATTVGDAERIQEAAMRSGAAVFVGHIYLYHPAFLAALELLPQLGSIRYVLCEGMNDNPRADSSVLWDWLAHDLSMAHAIFGCNPNSVSSWSLLGNEMPQAAISKFQFGNTPLASIISWVSPVQRRKTTIVGEMATLIFDDKAQPALVFYSRQGASPASPIFGKERPLTQEIGAFLQVCRSGQADGSHIEIATGIVRAIAAAEISIGLHGQLVTVE